MATRMQQLGGFVGEIANLSYEQLEKFQRIGGRWIAPLISQVGYPPDHDPACVRNRANLLHLQDWCRQLGIACGGWFMCWALNEAAADAAEIDRYVKGYNLAPVVLNCELAYKEHPNEFPHLLYEVRKRITTRTIGASVIDFNDSMIWNGGSLGHMACMRTLNIKPMPQWYSAPRYASPWFDPKQNMAWFQAHKTTGNFKCDASKNFQAVRMSEVHGTLEVTGLEGASLLKSLTSLASAKDDRNYSYGYSIYLLENAPESDFALMETTRGQLFLV